MSCPYALFNELAGGDGVCEYCGECHGSFEAPASPAKAGGPLCMNSSCSRPCFRGSLRLELAECVPNRVKMPDVMFYATCGQSCRRVIAQSSGLYRLDKDCEDYWKVLNDFHVHWEHKNRSPPQRASVFLVVARGAEERFCEKEESSYNVVTTYHGTHLACAAHKTHPRSFCPPCGREDCNVCGVITGGFDESRCGSEVAFQRFGAGIYFSDVSSKAADVLYCGGRALAEGVGAVFVCHVVAGAVGAPNEGGDSLLCHNGSHGLNYSERLIRTGDRVVPRFLLTFGLAA